MRLLLRILGSLLAAVFLLATALLWRLNEGPIGLDFLTPRIEETIRGLVPSLQISIGSTRLLWDRKMGEIVLSADGVSVAGGAGQSISIPSVAFNLDLEPLWHGHLTLAAVDLVGPSLRLVRQADGKFGLGVNGGSGAGLSDVLPPGDGAAASALRFLRLGVRDGSLTIDDKLSGQVWTLDEFALGLQMEESGVDAEASGRVDLTPVLGPAPGVPARLAKLAVKGDFKREADTLEIQEASLDLADLSLKGSGRVDGLRGGRPSAAATLQVARFAVDGLALYWPASLEAAARSWVTTNITAGTVKNGKVNLTAATGGDGSLSVASLQGGADFDGLRVRFVPTMPPVTGVAGSAKFSLAGGEFRVTQGRLLDDIAVTRALVQLPADRGPRIVIDADVNGPLTRAVAVLDGPPVEWSKIVGIKPRAGSLTGRLGLAFPLRDSLRYQDLGLTVEGTLRGVVVERVFGDFSATDANLDLVLRGAEVSLKGQGRLGGIPLRLDLHQTIGGRGGPRIEVAGDVDPPGWKALGFDVDSWLKGTTAVTAEVDLGAGKTVLVDATADLARTTLDFPGGLPKKAAGVPGKASARIQFAGGGLSRVDRFVLSFANNLVEANATRSPQEGWTTLNARAECSPAIGGPVGRVALDVTRGGRFTFSVPDLGAMLHALGYAYGQRGALTAQGKISLDQPGPPFDARVEVDNFVVERMPLLTRVLTLASLRGVLGALLQEGLRFDRTTMGLSYRPSTLTLANGVARSSSVTFMAAGTIDTATADLQIKGRVIPSYFGINEGVGKIPILGRFLTGGAAGAVQVIEYSATGEMGDPKVKIDALSSLTPQALQDLWRRFEW